MILRDFLCESCGAEIKDIMVESGVTTLECPWCEQQATAKMAIGKASRYRFCDWSPSAIDGVAKNEIKYKEIGIGSGPEDRIPSPKADEINKRRRGG